VNDTAVAMTGLIDQSNVTKIINLTRGNTIGWMFYASDTSGNWNRTDVWTFIVNNSPPTRVNLLEPGDLDGEVIANATPTFNWTNATDADNDQIYYDIFIRCFPSCSVDNREAFNLIDSNYTLSEPLKYYDDDGYSYEWWVRAFDGTSYGENSSKFIFSIGSVVSISLPIDTVSFGTLTHGQQEDTTDDNPPPFVIQNDGNCYVNVNLTVNRFLWDTGVSSDFQYKIDDVRGEGGGEEGAFNSSASATSWTDFTLENVTGIYQLNYSDNRDSAEIDIGIIVPSGEPSGSKRSEVLFSAYYVKVT